MSSRATIRYNTDPGFRDSRRRQSKAYYDKVKDTEEFKIKNRERVKLWREKNPDKVRVSAASEEAKAKRRAKYAAGLIKKYPVSKESRERYKLKQKEMRVVAKMILSNPDYAASLDPQYREKIVSSYQRELERARQYYAAHRTELRAQQKAARDANLEHYRRLGRESYHRRARAKVLVNRHRGSK